MTSNSNPKTAQLLKRVAAVFRILEGDTFRVKAYNNAAIAIENSAESIFDLWQQDKLSTVPGIGEALQKYLSEYFQKGKVRHFDTVLKKVPAGMFSLMDIRGIGPITAYKIAKKFKLNKEDSAKNDLKKLLSEGKLSQIDGFQTKTVAKIQKALDLGSVTKTKRLLLGEALTIAEDYLQFLRLSPHIKEAETLGSLRRRLSTVGDIDLAIRSDKPKEAMSHALTYPQIAGVITQGDRLIHVQLKNGYEIDVKHSFPDQWGSLLQHYTGSKLHNIKLRTLALAKGFSLSEYGIKMGIKQHNFQDEDSFYRFLGLQYIPPEMREDKGEIELAQKKQIPSLISLGDIKGDLHVHSDYSFPTSHDLGDSPLKDLLDYAVENHYQYLGLTDHNPKFADLSETAKKKILIQRKNYLLDAYRAYEKRVKRCTTKLLIGMEVDIRSNGELALSDSLMDLLDYAIVSIHSSFDQSLQDNTKRIIKALRHPKAIILGHPTGRMLNLREPLQANWEQIFSYCAQNHKIIEVNASPSRLDLPDDLIKQAASQGVSLCLNTDSHDLSQMSFMKYGVWQARRGWATKESVVNTFSFQDLCKVINLCS